MFLTFVHQTTIVLNEFTLLYIGLSKVLKVSKV